MKNENYLIIKHSGNQPLSEFKIFQAVSLLNEREKYLVLNAGNSFLNPIVRVEWWEVSLVLPCASNFTTFIRDPRVKNPA